MSKHVKNLDGSSLVIPLDNNPKIAEMLYQVSTENISIPRWFD